MKKNNKITFIIVFLFVLLLGSSYAGENEYILTHEYSFKNNKKTALSSDCYLDFLIGSGDIVQYQEDESITISPIPDEIRTDECGNQHAYYNLEGLAGGAKFSVTIKRKVKAGTYAEIIPARTNTEYLEENEKYLLPQEGIESDDPDIISKAEELTEDMPSDYKKAQAIFEFINLNMTYDTSKVYANKGAKSALSTMRGVCEEYATLFVAMCRAANIPSRVIVGYSIQEEQQEFSGEKITIKSLVDHAWAEIYLQDFGWVPVDPVVKYTQTDSSKESACLEYFCNILEPSYIATGLYQYGVYGVYGIGIKDTYSGDKIEEVSDELNEDHKFEDIEDYNWAEEAIEYLYSIDVIKGYSDTEYGPEKNISRIEFITMLSRALKHIETTYESRGLVYYYPDYDTSHWSKEEYDYLMRCYQAKNPSDIASAGFYDIVKVFGEGKLDVDKPITRAEVVALMDAFLADDYTVTKLTDISGNKFENSIVKAYNRGLIVGYPDKTFRPNNNITRAEIAVIIERYIGNEAYEFLKK